MLDQMRNFCENNAECRRVMVLSYFNEYPPFTRAQCGRTCDNCQQYALIEERDVSDHCREILHILRQIKGSVGGEIMLYFLLYRITEYFTNIIE